MIDRIDSSFSLSKQNHNKKNFLKICHPYYYRSQLKRERLSKKNTDEWPVEKIEKIIS
jgi:hypothetical protein